MNNELGELTERLAAKEREVSRLSEEATRLTGALIRMGRGHVGDEAVLRLATESAEAWEETALRWRACAEAATAELEREKYGCLRSHTRDAERLVELHDALAKAQRVADTALAWYEQPGVVRMVELAAACRSYRAAETLP